MKNAGKYMIIVLATAMLALAGCSRSKVIPDGELRGIFREIFLTNAYMEQHRGRMTSFNLDSLDVYRPILSRYGYTVKDLEYTVNNFSTRKSYRLSDVVNEVITELEKEEDNLRYRIAAKDSIEARSKRLLRREVYHDSLVVASRIADTARLRQYIPIVDSGEYYISFYYTLDSLEENKSLRNTAFTLGGTGRERNVMSAWMSQGRRQRSSSTFTPEKGDTAIRIQWGNYPAKDMKRPDLKIDSITLYYTPPLRTAMDSAALLIFRHIPFSDSLIHAKAAQDSIPLSLHPPGIPEKWGSDDK